MNEKEHWERIAPAYNEEIFDVYASDRNKRLPKYFKKHLNQSGLAIDFGCGNGKSLPYLSPLFKKVVGIDISKGLLQQARQRGFSNVELKQKDLTKKNLKLPLADFAFCCNVIMFPVIEKNYIMFNNVRNALKPGASAVIVVPSLESALFSSWTLIDLYRREGVDPKDIPSSEFHYFKGDKRDILQGIVHIDGVPTKHYTESELKVILREAGLTITNLERLEYDWNTELTDVPTWLKDPYPWDWLIECKKV